MGWLRRFREFVVEVWSELKKTTWPGRREVSGTTMVVIVTVLICAGFLFVVDKLLETAMRNIFDVVGR